jgi:magnesium transporter
VADSSFEAPPRPSAVIEVDERLAADLEMLLQDGQQGMVLNIVRDLHPADLAVLLRRLPEEAAATLLDWLPEEQASLALTEIEGTRRTDLLEEWNADEIVAILDGMDSDDAADLLADLPSEVADQVLPRLEDAAEVGSLLSYEEDTAGGLMGTEFVTVPNTATVGEATEELRRQAEEVDPVYALYVVDEMGRLEGIVDLKDLVLARSRTPIMTLTRTDVITVEPSRDQEEVARLMERYDLVVLPVVTDDGRLIGRITIDDVVDVIREEAEEDFQRASGLTGAEELTTGVVAVSRGRMPWLLVGLAGAAMSGLVIGTFEESLEQAVVLAMFIPIVTAMGGNAAVQSGAITIQGLATGELWSRDLYSRLGKEVAVALLNGVLLGGLVTGVIFATGLGGEVMPRLGLTVGVTMFLVILLATTNGAMVPLILNRLGIDPSLSMGPFVTTLNDIIGLTVYFLMASILFF